MIDMIKRNLILFVVIGAFSSVLLFFSVYNLLNERPEDSRISISRFDAVIVVNEDGSMNVKEIWNMDYKQGYTVRFRDIDFAMYDDYYPEELNVHTFSETPAFDDTAANASIFANNINITNNIDVGYSFNNDFDELGYPVDCEPHSNYCESIFMGFNSHYRLQDNMTFVYEYKIENAVVNFGDVADLNWSLFGFAESDIESGRIDIILPENILNKDELDVFSHMKYSDTSVLSNSKVRIDFENLDKDSKASFRLMMPLEIFSMSDVSGNWYLKSNFIDFEDDLQAEYQKHEFIETYYMLTPFILIVIMAVIIYALQLFVFQAKKMKTEGDVTHPPTNISPAIVNYLLNNGIFKKEVITATLLDLCRRGYVDIIDTNKEDDEVVFQIKHTLQVKDLMGHEQALMHWLFEKDLSIDKVSSITLEARAKSATDVSDFYNNYRNFVILVSHQGRKYKFIENTLGDRKLFSYSAAIIPLAYMAYTVGISGIYNINLFIPISFSVTIIVLLHYFIITRSKLTKAGSEAYTKWMKYKKHVISAKSYSHADMEDVEYLDELLVFATLFGKAEKVMDQLSIDAANPTRTRPVIPHQSTLYNQNSGYYNRHRPYWYRPWYRTYHRRMPKSKSSMGMFSGRTSGGFRSSGGFKSSGGFRSSGGSRSSGGFRGGGGRSR